MWSLHKAKWPNGKWPSSRDSAWWHGWDSTSTWNWSTGWNDGWDEAKWPGARWHEPAWQDDSLESLSDDSGQDIHAPEKYPWGNCAELQEQRDDEREVESPPPAPEVSEIETARQNLPTRTKEEEQAELKRLHAKALVRFHLRQPECDSDEGASVSPDTPWPGEVDIDTSIAEFDPLTGGVICKLCNLSLNSKSQYQDHLKGKKHFKKVSAEERKKGERVNGHNSNQIFTVKTVTCTGKEDGAVQVWGAYVPAASYQ